jgi:Sigma-70, region 4
LGMSPKPTDWFFVSRDVEGMTTEETAGRPEVSPENVKVRLQRARGGLRKQLYEAVGATSARCSQLHAVRCDRDVKVVGTILGIPFAETKPDSP